MVSRDDGVIKSERQQNRLHCLLVQGASQMELNATADASCHSHLLGVSRLLETKMLLTFVNVRMFSVISDKVKKGCQVVGVSGELSIFNSDVFVFGKIKLKS